MLLSHQTSLKEVLFTVPIKQWMEISQQISILAKHVPIHMQRTNHGGKLTLEKFTALQVLRSLIEWTVVPKD